MDTNLVLGMIEHAETPANQSEDDDWYAVCIVLYTEHNTDELLSCRILLCVSG